MSMRFKLYALYQLEVDSEQRFWGVLGGDEPSRASGAWLTRVQPGLTRD